MFVVGLTGGIGSGKTIVADLFAARGVTIVDTDLIAHRITAPHGAAMQRSQTSSAPEFVAPRRIARPREDARARYSPTMRAKARLEAITHPHHPCRNRAPHERGERPLCHSGCAAAASNRVSGRRAWIAYLSSIAASRRKSCASRAATVLRGEQVLAIIARQATARSAARRRRRRDRQRKLPARAIGAQVEAHAQHLYLSLAGGSSDMTAPRFIAKARRQFTYVSQLSSTARSNRRETREKTCEKRHQKSVMIARVVSRH